MRVDLSGRGAIVTGAGGGIGRAVTLSLAALGARVVATDVAEEAGRETQALAREAGGDVVFEQLDVTAPDDVARCVAEAHARLGSLDILMNNAGWQGPVAAIPDYPLADFDRLMSINVRGIFLLLQNVLPVMAAQGRGAVVNTASSAAHLGVRRLAPYSASKHAVLGLTKSASLEFARKGVRVNAICPGPVDTPMIAAIEEGEAGEGAAAMRAKRLRSIPDGRYGTVEEVADLMVYLVSDHSRHITGQGIHINGGYHSI